jgi:hypothetical protein
LATGHVADHGNERVASSAHQPLGLSLTAQPELAVDAADDEIEAAQHLTGGSRAIAGGTGSH